MSDQGFSKIHGVPTKLLYVYFIRLASLFVVSSQMELTPFHSQVISICSWVRFLFTFGFNKSSEHKNSVHVFRNTDFSTDLELSPMHSVTNALTHHTRSSWTEGFFYIPLLQSHTQHLFHTQIQTAHYLLLYGLTSHQTLLRLSSKLRQELLSSRSKQSAFQAE